MNSYVQRANLDSPADRNSGHTNEGLAAISGARANLGFSVTPKGALTWT